MDEETVSLRDEKLSIQCYDVDAVMNLIPDATGTSTIDVKKTLTPNVLSIPLSRPGRKSPENSAIVTLHYPNMTRRPPPDTDSTNATIIQESSQSASDKPDSVRCGHSRLGVYVTDGPMSVRNWMGYLASAIGIAKKYGA
jgi:hypothetical protein